MPSTPFDQKKIPAIPENGMHKPAYDVVSITGGDRFAFLQGLATNDLTLLSPMRIVPSLFLDTSGKVLHFVFIAQTRNELLLCLEPEATDTMMSFLDYFHIREDVRYKTDESGKNFFILYGDASKKLTADGHNPFYHDARFSCLMSDDADALYETGRRLGISVLNAETFQSAGHMLNFPTTATHSAKRKFPHETRLDNYISFTKGCFVGQEPVSRMEHKFPATKRRIVLKSPVALTIGAPVLASGTPIGKITSVASLPYCGHFYAFARVKIALIGKGQRITDNNGTLLTVIADD